MAQGHKVHVKRPVVGSIPTRVYSNLFFNFFTRPRPGVEAKRGIEF